MENTNMNMPQTIFEDSFSEEVWGTTYKDHRDDTVDHTMFRTAKAAASTELTEELQRYWTDEFYDMLSGFKSTTGGRIYSNAGTEWSGTTLMNCFVAPRATYDIDSLESIIKDVHNQCQTLKSEGGWGQNFSYIRPRGSFIKGIGVESPGAVKYMEIFDKTSDVITSGSGKKSDNKTAKGKIRKGAMMGVMDCLGGNTPINTTNGKVMIKDLVGTQPLLYCTDGQGNVFIRQALLVWSKGVKKTIKVQFDNDDYIECTPDHEFMLNNGTFKKAKDLTHGDSLSVLSKRLQNQYIHLSVTGSRRVVAEHNAIYEMKYGEFPTIMGKTRNKNSTVAHHIDHNKLNNAPENIQQMTLGEHASHHSDILRMHQSDRAVEMKGKTWEEFYGTEKASIVKSRYTQKRIGSTPWNKGMKFNVEATNHKVLWVSESIEQEVFDISMPDYHNFAANGVFVHNCWHPDIIEFITAKQQPGRLSKFNISVNCTDDFMQRVDRITQIDKILSTETATDSLNTELTSELEAEKAKLDQWDLRFPDTQHPSYKTEWQGDIKKWDAAGYPTTIVRQISAMWLWNLIMESTYNRAEPGVLFLDRANHFGPLNYLETIFATNPSMPAGTLVHTKAGICPIEQLENQIFEVKSLDGSWAPAKCRMSGENEELLTISLGANKDIQSTKKHRWPVYDKRMNRLYKVDASELKPGDLIPLNRNEDIGIYGDMSLTYDEGLLIGYLVGDGWFVKKNKTDPSNHEYNVGITFGTHEREMATRILGIMNSLKVIPSSICEKENELYIQCSEQNFVEQLINKYKLVPGEKDIPASVWQGNDQYVKGFVDGLLSADGHVMFDDHNQKIILTTSRESLAKNFGKLLGFAGIPVNIWTRTLNNTQVSFPNGKTYDREYERWDVAVNGTSIINFFNVFTISHPDKQKKLETVVNYVHGRRAHQSSQYAEVVSVIPGGTGKVWDISVAHDQHVFPTEWCYTGNCGEQTLAPGGVCNLGSVNLTQFLNATRTGFDLDKIKVYTRKLTRFLDNINSLSNAPLPEYADSMKNKRRIGIGILGWGSALYMLKTRFGSDAAARLRDSVMSSIAREAYMTSIDLAEEKGMFAYCDPEKHAEGVFVKSLDLPEVYMKKLRTTGIRNSSLLSIQPTGNTSIFANIVSGGMEPVFMPEYVRTVIVSSAPADIIDVCPNWYEGEWHETDMFKFTKEGDEEILRGTGPDGTVYKIDKGRGLVKEVLCQDYGVRWLAKRGEWDPTADWAVSTVDLSVQDHVNDMRGFARWIDSAMSKTINIPNTYPFVNFKDIYLDTYNSGYVKGVTTYRSGTMLSVLAAKEETQPTKCEEIILDDVKVPTQGPAVFSTIKAEGKKYYLTSVMDVSQSTPIALFVHTNHRERTATTHDAVERLLELAVLKGIPVKWISDVESKIVNDNNVTKLARSISLLLRHGVLIRNIVHVLNQVDNVFVGTFLFQIRKYLSQFIQNGEAVEGEKCELCGGQIVFQEGCKHCSSCGNSKCG